ncbi:MAG: hypothetical protein QHH10_09715 [Peptococcaceae bacterium]|nr:hypothetical protein [Peptococcaceae bacterium]
MSDLQTNASMKPESERITRYMWMVLFVALCGYIFDAFEVMLYSNALVDIKKEFSFNFAGSGTVMTLSLLGMLSGACSGARSRTK